MFNSIKERIQDHKNLKKFNAVNCLRKQKNVDKQNLDKRIEEIIGRINYVVESTTEEHTVIYQVHDYERDMYDRIDEYFKNLGFKVIFISIPELNNEQYMIISWM